MCGRCAGQRFGREVTGMDGIGAALGVVGLRVGPQHVLVSLVPLVCVLVAVAGLIAMVVLAAMLALILRQESRQRPPAGQAGPPEGC